MKKLLALTLSLAMAAAFLTACGNDEDSSSTSETTPASNVSDSSSEDDSVADDSSEDESIADESTDDSASGEVTAQSAVDYALTVGEWGMGINANFLDSEFVEDKNAYLTEYLGVSGEEFNEVALAISMISAQPDTIMVIDAGENLDAAVAALENFKEMKIGSAWYPEETEVYSAAVVGSVGNYAYYIAHRTVADVETALKDYLA